MTYETILYREEGAVGWLTLNRPDDGNMFTHKMCHEIRDCVNDIRRETRTRVLVITGAGDKFFCIGGRKDGMEDSTLYAGMLPTLEIYESIERLQKPVIAALKGAFGARHNGVSGLSRMSHDLLLRLYLDTDESHELGEAFRGKRDPDPDKFGH